MNIPAPPEWLDGWGAVLIILALAILNVWQFYKYHDVKGRLAHIFEHGHAPDGKAVVTVEPAIVPPDKPATPWKV